MSSISPTSKLTAGASPAKPLEETITNAPTMKVPSGDKDAKKAVEVLKPRPSHSRKKTDISGISDYRNLCMLMETVENFAIKETRVSTAKDMIADIQKHFKSRVTDDPEEMENFKKFYPTFWELAFKTNVNSDS